MKNFDEGYIKNTHLNTGAQKKTVLGPAGLCHKGRSEVGTILSTEPISELYTDDKKRTIFWVLSCNKNIYLILNLRVISVSCQN